MKNTSTSLFSQVLNQVSRQGFSDIVMNKNGNKHKQSFGCWSHFVSMMFCQLAEANSLRKICGDLKTCGGKLNHLGVETAPSKSNLSHANKHRNPDIFKEVFFMLLNHCKAIAPKHKFTFNKKLYSLDATYDIPDYDLKQYEGNILSDEVIFLRGAQNKYPESLRKVVVCDIENHQTLTLLTNNKERWQIESFFKMFKQNLKIKTFVGASENAVKIQVWTALIAILLLKYLKFLSKAKWHFSTLVTFLKWNLFVYRDLQQWLDQPFTKLPEPE